MSTTRSRRSATRRRRFCGTNAEFAGLRIVQPWIRRVALQSRLDRLAQQRVFRLRPLRDVDVGEQLRRLAEHHDAVADADRLFQLMRDQDRGRAAFARQRQEGLAQFRRRHLVEMAEGLVGQQDIGLHREGARDRHALAHAAGQFVRIGIGELAEAQPVEPGQRALALLVLRQADQFERQLGVVERRAPRQQAVLLEHGGDPAAEMIEVGVRALVADADGAFGRRFEPDHQVEEGGFAAAGLADDRHDFARRDGQIEPVDGDHRLPGGGLPEHLAQAARPRSAAAALAASCAPPQQPRFDPRHHGFEQEQQRHQHDASRRTRRRPRTIPAPPTIDGRCRSPRRPARRW